MSAVRTCRVCGCTQARACVDERGPCWWAGPDLCSHCETHDQSDPALTPGAEPSEWKWYAGTDGERFGVGPCDTREALIAEALAERLGEERDVETDPVTGDFVRTQLRCRFWVLEAIPYGAIELAEYFDAMEWFGNLENGALSDLSDPDGDPMLDHITKAQGADLTAKVAAVIRQWQADHKIEATAWSFAASRGAERVDLLAPPRVAAEGEA